MKKVVLLTIAVLLAALLAGCAASDKAPPVISAVSASSLSISTATITWATDELATSQVEYGLTTSYGSTTTLDTSLVTSHNVNLSGLAANTPYHYRVKSNDAGGNEAVSGDYSFTTYAATETFTITSSAGAHGSILPSGVVTVSYGASQGFVVTPDPGYHIADVLVDGVSIGTVGSFEFVAASSDHTISASLYIGDDLALEYLPTLRFEDGANATYFPVDCTFDGDYDASNNEAHYTEVRNEPAEPVWVYIHEVQLGGLTYIEYWYYYVYNNYFNTHYDDWECMIVVLDSHRNPVIVRYGSHGIMRDCARTQVEWDGTHPIAYVEEGSH
ncbi:MAG: fibronectin type III domain-containing protein, partial [Chloroflexi bacterium]|nr:fibronectin type III domain-containing protein [Chloroflexota bacterium]